MNKLKGVSPWAAAAKNYFTTKELTAVYQTEHNDFLIGVYNNEDTFWLEITWPDGGRLAFRMAYAPGAKFAIASITETDKQVLFLLETFTGIYKVILTLPQNQEETIVRYTTSITLNSILVIPYWPRDIVPLGSSGFADGQLHMTQTGTRSGMLFFSMTEPKSGSVLYLQNLTSLNDYCQETETSAGDLVGGEWPEIGFALPPAITKPLPKNQGIVISDAIINLNTTVPANDCELAELFLNMLAKSYLQLPRPDTKYHDWPSILDKGLEDLQRNHGCWKHVNGDSYLNAYLCDYATPPEIMVQLAVLLPLSDYKNWSKKEMTAIPDITRGLPKFYDPKIGTVVRWLPSAADKLNQSEEQLKPNVMDSWYLHHPLLNLSRLAMMGDKSAEKLFLDSIDFAIKVAHHFKYHWPVFYNMETLEVIKAETVPGMGGQKDVPGLYALVMLHAFKLTNNKRFLEEAKKAAKTLQGLGLNLFYQANNTAFGANAMLWLWQETKDKLYLDLSYLCIANIFKNVHLWECNYGYAKHYPTFFGVFPLNDAPYTAVYEEQEVFAAFHNYLLYADGENILPSVKLLLAEFIRNITHRAAYYYPPNLPKEMFSDEVKMGEVDPNMWIALEDIHDGWEKSGEVGQEVYGAGVAFGIVPRHYYIAKNDQFMVYVDYPTDHFRETKTRLSFIVKGDKHLSCRMILLNKAGSKLPKFTVSDNNNTTIKPIKTNKNKVEYTIQGDQKIQISWK